MKINDKVFTIIQRIWLQKLVTLFASRKKRKLKNNTVQLVEMGNPESHYFELTFILNSHLNML